MASPPPILRPTIASLVDPIATQTPRQLKANSTRVKNLQYMLDEINLLKRQTESQTQDDGGAKTFTLFRKIPVELRLKVWGEILNNEEVFVIGWRDHDSSPVLRTEDEQDEQFGSWFDYTVHTILSTSKQSLLHVNAEARYEALKALQPFKLDGKTTWFNAATDSAWFPTFDRDSAFMRHEGFKVDFKLECLTIRYKYWVGHNGFYGNFAVRGKDSYRLYGERGLKDVVLVLGRKDLNPGLPGRKIVTSASQPHEFFAQWDSELDIDEASWEMVAKEEMQHMIDWNEERLELREDMMTDEDNPWDAETANQCPETADDITVPNITFRLEIDTSFL